MIYAVCIAIIVIIVFLIVLSFYNQKRKIELYNVKFNDSINSINLLEEAELESISKIIKLLKIKKDNKLVKDLNDIKEEEKDTFEIDEYLGKTNVELKDYFEYNKVTFTEELVNTLREYKKTRVESLALKEYYNSNVEKYNSYIKKITHLLIRIIKKAKIKEKFEIKKEVEFEILKKKDSSK